MNSCNIDYKFLLDMDNNPIIVFNSYGKIIFVNNNGEVLLSYVSPKEIFKLAMDNAPKDYGNKTTQIELKITDLVIKICIINMISVKRH